MLNPRRKSALQIVYRTLRVKLDFSVFTNVFHVSTARKQGLVSVHRVQVL